MNRPPPRQESSEGTRARILRRLDSLREDLTTEISGLQNLLTEARGLWTALCREVVAGRTEQAHADRVRLEQTVEESLRTIREWLPIARAVLGPSGREVVELDTMAQEAERFWPRIFARWKTPEDLEDLVANATAPAREQLDAVTRKYGFPHVWHSADDTPV
jgi:hypothetical protein